MDSNQSPVFPPAEDINRVAITEEQHQTPDGNPPTPDGNPPTVEEKPAGMLFDSISYRSVEDIPRFIDNMSINDAAMVILTTSAYAHKKGLLTLLESEVVSKAIRVFTAPRTPQHQPEEKILQPTP